MHIPDGFIDAKVALGTAAIAAAGVAGAVGKLRRSLGHGTAPMIGLGAAFVFAAQMINFPVAGGTSGHLLGGVLVATVLGLPAAVLIMTTVLIVQCLLFADGGVTALGANVTNMALAAPVVGWAVVRLFRRIMGDPFGLLLGVCFGGWCGTVAAAFLCAAQIRLSGTVADNLIFPAMVGIHMLIGLAEGVISAFVVAALLKLEPDLLDIAPRHAGIRGHVFGFVFATIIGLVLFGVPVASTQPDGLERVAETLGFSGAAENAGLWRAPAPDYVIEFAGLKLGAVGTVASGLIGTLGAYIVGVVLARRLARGIEGHASAVPAQSNHLEPD